MEINITSNECISSPNFPSYYGNNVDCVWTLYAEDLHTITLNFTHFELQNASYGSCSSDYLDIRENKGSREGERIAQ